MQRALVEVGAAAGADDPTSPESILDALASLRRQAEHANRWRDNEILAANEARADAADLRRQLAEVQAEIAAVPRPEIGELCDLIGNSTTAISLDCPAGWAVREWLETYDAADLRRQFEQERVEIGMLRRQLQEGEQSALSHAIGQIFYLRRQLAEERMRANAAEFAVAQQRDEAADLRRQLEHANRWRDNEILAANEARADAADLRRQLDDARQIYGVSQHVGDDIERLLWGAADSIVLRRQLEYANRWRESAILDANEARSEAADLRRQVDAVPIDEIDDLYVAYAYAVSGWPEGKAQQFPQVGRWLRILPADDTPHGAEKGDA